MTFVFPLKTIVFFLATMPLCVALTTRYRGGLACFLRDEQNATTRF